jgi:cytochrome c oxidase cbb3-type subunit III
MTRGLALLIFAGALLAQQPGEALFFGKAACGSCHQVNGRGGVVGPDLSNAGRLSAEALHQKIVDPSANPNPGGRGGPSSMVVRTKDGKEIRGIRRAEDTFSLLLTDSAGALQRFDKQELASFALEQKSLMPADFAQRLSEPEIQSLVT